MQATRFVFDRGPSDDDVPMSAGKDLAAGNVERRILLVRPGVLGEALLTEGVHNTSDADPIDCAGAHGAWLGAGIERACSHLCLSHSARQRTTRQHFRMLRGVSRGTYRIVACLDECLPLRIHNERAERMASFAARTAGELDCAT